MAVGSGSNVDDPDSHPAEKNRADILVCDPANCKLHVYAYGIRNAGGGIAVNPDTGELWCSVNERDALGDNLVPDYITHVQPNGFYGWPWWYIGGHQDPRHKGKRPELERQSHRARRSACSRTMLRWNLLFTRAINFPQNIRETFSPPSTARGINRCAWVMK